MNRYLTIASLLVLLPSTLLAAKKAPWAPFKLHSVTTEVAVVEIHTSIVGSEKEIVKRLRGVIAKHHECREVFVALQQGSDNIISRLNGLLGFSPNEKQRRLQGRILKTLPAAPVTIADGPEFRVQVIPKETIKDHMRAGGGAARVSVRPGDRRGNLDISGITGFEYSARGSRRGTDKHLCTRHIPGHGRRGC